MTITKERAMELIANGGEMRGAEIRDLTPAETLCALWGVDGYAIVKYVDTIDTPAMTYDEFAHHCTACGGNWGEMLLTGIRELYPTVWEMIPDNMGIFAWTAICETLALLNIKGN